MWTAGSALQHLCPQHEVRAAGSLRVTQALASRRRSRALPGLPGRPGWPCVPTAPRNPRRNPIPDAVFSPRGCPALDAGREVSGSEVARHTLVRNKTRAGGAGRESTGPKDGSRDPEELQRTWDRVAAVHAQGGGEPRTPVHNDPAGKFQSL